MASKIKFVGRKLGGKPVFLSEKRGYISLRSKAEVDVKQQANQKKSQFETALKNAFSLLEKKDFNSAGLLFKIRSFKDSRYYFLTGFESHGIKVDVVRIPINVKTKQDIVKSMEILNLMRGSKTDFIKTTLNKHKKAKLIALVKEILARKKVIV